MSLESFTSSWEIPRIFKTGFATFYLIDMEKELMNR